MVVLQLNKGCRELVCGSASYMRAVGAPPHMSPVSCTTVAAVVIAAVVVVAVSPPADECCAARCGRFTPHFQRSLVRVLLLLLFRHLRDERIMSIEVSTFLVYTSKTLVVGLAWLGFSSEACQ